MHGSPPSPRSFAGLAGDASWGDKIFAFGGIIGSGFSAGYEQISCLIVMQNLLHSKISKVIARACHFKLCEHVLILMCAIGSRSYK